MVSVYFDPFFLIIIIGEGGTYFLYLKVGIGLLPINKKAEISPSFFSVHLHTEDQTANFR